MILEIIRISMKEDNQIDLFLSFCVFLLDIRKKKTHHVCERNLTSMHFNALLDLCFSVIARIKFSSLIAWPNI